MEVELCQNHVTVNVQTVIAIATVIRRVIAHATVVNKKGLMKHILETEITAEWSALKRLAQSIIKAPSVADDVLQTAFLKALTTKSLPKSEGKILPWFKTIIRNTALDVLRKQKQLKLYELKTSIEPSIENEAFESSLCSCILTLLSQLSESDQHILKELDINENSLDSISKKMNLSKNTLKVRRHRARQRLKKVVMSICKIGSSKECDTCNCD